MEAGRQALNMLITSMRYEAAPPGHDVLAVTDASAMLEPGLWGVNVEGDVAVLTEPAAHLERLDLRENR